MKGDWNRVLSSRGTMQGFYYYDLADIIALQAFWGDLESVEDAQGVAKGYPLRVDSTVGLAEVWGTLSPFKPAQSNDLPRERS